MAKRAVLTYVVAAASVVISFGVWFDGDSPDWGKWGALAAWDIYAGSYWALISSVFAHADYLHLGFNLYWLSVLGRPLERAIGTWRWLALFLASAWVSSAAQLAVSGDTGIGMSGVGYAQLGFMWLAQDRFPDFKRVIDRRLIAVFVIWLLFCWGATVIRVANVGNAAHFWGLVFGITVGGVTRARWRALAMCGSVVLCLVATFTLVWAPWSADWTGVKAAAAHEDQRYEDALYWYRRCLELDTDDVMGVWDNTAEVCFHLEDRIGFEEAVRELFRYDRSRAREWEAVWPRSGAGEKR